MPSTLNISLPGLDSEAVMLALKDIVAISNGSACTSQNYTASHVLAAMHLPEDHSKGALRLSWCHMTPDVPWEAVVEACRSLMQEELQVHPAVIASSVSTVKTWRSPAI